MPTTQDVSLAFDTCDASQTSPPAAKQQQLLTTESPALQRKRFQAGNDNKGNMTAAKKTSVEREENKSSLIPLTKNEAQPQRVPGNHSPIGNLLQFSLKLS